jgi:hypothetical protein
MTLEMWNSDGRLDRGLRAAAWGGAALLFLLPVAAEQLWAEMAWTASDFVFWGVMLLLALGAFEASMRASRNWAYRAGAVVAIGSAFLLVWVNGAVGIIGSEDNPANLLYAGVLTLAIGGAVGAGARPQGLARSLTATAIAQVLVGALALARGWGAGTEPNWLAAIVGATAVFGAAWLLAAWLFRAAARQLTASGGGS